MSTLKVNTVESATTPTVLISDGLSVSGVSTLTGGLKVGTAITMSSNGNFGITGIMTATNFVGGGSGLTGLTAGKLLKIHYAATNTATTITTPSRADTGLTVTFTPEALGSTFYIQANQFGLNGVSSDQALFNLYLMRSIDGGTASELEEYYYLGNYTTNDRAYWGSPLGYKDTPSYSAGQTINYHIECGFYTGNYGLNYIAQVGQAKSSIFVYEFGA